MSEPSVLVFLDDGTGTFPIDISGTVSLEAGITRTMGREDYDDTISPGQLTLTLDNGDNTFYGSGEGWDTTGWDTGPWGGGGIALTLNQKIRLIVNGRNKFTGYIQQTPLSWPGGGDEFSTIAVTAVDAMSRFARMKLGSAFDEEIKADRATLVAYYPLTGGSDTTVEYDASGQFISGALQINHGQSPLPAWGNDYGSPDGTTGVEFTISIGDSGSYLSSIATGPNSIWTGTSLHAEIVFTCKPISNIDISLLALAGIQVMALDPGGRLIVFGTQFSSGLDDGALHVASVEATGSGTYDVWIDGVNVGSGSTPYPSFSNGWTQVGEGAILTGLGASGSTYTVARVNIGSARLSDSRIQAHHLAAMTDCAGETPAERYTRVANYLGVAIGSLDTSGTRVLGPAGQAGKSLADVLTDTSGAALGLAYVDGDGNLSSVNGSSTASQVTPVVSLDANWASPDTAIQNDLEKLLNDITGQASSSANVIPASDQTSIDLHGSYQQSFTWNVEDDETAFQLTWWTLRNFSTPRPRAPQLVLDLLTMSDTSDAESVTVGSYIQITDMPEQSPIGDTLNLIAEGLTEVISDDEWSLSTNNVQRDVYTGWILGDPVYGILGETTVLFPT